ncbi:MAG: Hsp20/alpha crystallin family protein [Spirochaetes bacterium]|nr:Hsp20/alpha crystallin family protein [Spirochaetota bacterium]
MRPLKSLLTEFNNLDIEVRKLFADFFSHENPLLMVTETHWRPNTDIYETSRGTIIKIELSGVKQKDIDITYDRGKLIIRGRRSDYSIPDKVKCKQIEIHYGEFERIINIQKISEKAIDIDNIKATYKDGLLFILLPHLKEAAPEKELKIKIEGEK